MLCIPGYAMPCALLKLFFDPRLLYTLVRSWGGSTAFSASPKLFSNLLTEVGKLDFPAILSLNSDQVILGKVLDSIGGLS